MIKIHKKNRRENLVFTWEKKQQNIILYLKNRKQFKCEKSIKKHWQQQVLLFGKILIQFMFWMFTIKTITKKSFKMRWSEWEREWVKEREFFELSKLLKYKKKYFLYPENKSKAPSTWINDFTSNPQHFFQIANFCRKNHWENCSGKSLNCILFCTFENNIEKRRKKFVKLMRIFSLFFFSCWLEFFFFIYLKKSWKIKFSQIYP